MKTHLNYIILWVFCWTILLWTLIELKETIEELTKKNTQILHEISVLQERTQDISQKTNSIFNTLEQWELTK